MTFQRRVTGVLVLVIGSFILLAASVVTPLAYRENLEGMRQMVRGIAATGTLSIDGDRHEAIPPNPSAVTLPAYQELQNQLRKILGTNPGLRYVWTMVPGKQPDEMLFVGDVGGAEPKPGLAYKASRIPELLAGFQGPSADRTPVKDLWGISVSGYAPIRNKTGKVVAILGVDVYGKQLYEFRRRCQIFLAVSLGLGIFAAVLLGWLLGRWIAHPLDQLVHGMRRVGAGELSHEVKLATGDEFQEAAGAFNRMTKAFSVAQRNLRESFINAVRSLMTALEAKDPYTRGHSESVTEYAIQIAKALAKSSREIETLNRLAVLHDIGKIGIHDAVLQKPSFFTPEERQAMQVHPTIGAKILAPLGLTPEELALIVSHHEREDGSGYPQGLDRSKISDLVAIVSVADAYDAMTSHRPHRPAMKPQEALEELRRAAGTQFRPEMVEALAYILQQQSTA